MVVALASGLAGFRRQTAFLSTGFILNSEWSHRFRASRKWTASHPTPECNEIPQVLFFRIGSERNPCLDHSLWPGGWSTSRSRIGAHALQVARGELACPESCGLMVRVGWVLLQKKIQTKTLSITKKGSGPWKQI